MTQFQRSTLTADQRDRGKLRDSDVGIQARDSRFHMVGSGEMIGFQICFQNRTHKVWVMV